jgi:hypothetical protein
MAKKINKRMQEFEEVGGRGKYEMSKGQGRSLDDIIAIFKEYRETGKIDEKKWAIR